jgi:hypothetical protein
VNLPLRKGVGRRYANNGSFTPARRRIDERGSTRAAPSTPCCAFSLSRKSWPARCRFVHARSMLLDCLTG